MRFSKLASNYGLVALAILKADPGWSYRFARPLLDREDASTQWYVGLMHHYGYRAKEDLRIARKWYERAAAQGLSLARWALADLDLHAEAGNLGGEGKNVLSLYHARFNPAKLRCSD